MNVNEVPMARWGASMITRKLGLIFAGRINDGIGDLVVELILYFAMAKTIPNPHEHWVCGGSIVSYVFFLEKKKQTDKKEKKENTHRESYIYIYL
jgi:hypothetical protein